MWKKQLQSKIIQTEQSHIYKNKLQSYLFFKWTLNTQQTKIVTSLQNMTNYGIFVFYLNSAEPAAAVFQTEPW